MAIPAAAGLPGVVRAPAPAGGQEKFSRAMEGAPAKVGPSAVKPLAVSAARPQPPQVAHFAKAPSLGRAHAGAIHSKTVTLKAVEAVGRVDATRMQKVGRVLDQVNGAQSRLDRILKLAESGRTFTPAELLSLQAQVSQASQELDLAGKVVEKATSGVKQLLSTQV